MKRSFKCNKCEAAVYLPLKIKTVLSWHASLRSWKSLASRRFFFFLHFNAALGSSYSVFWTKDRNTFTVTFSVATVSQNLKLQ